MRIRPVAGLVAVPLLILGSWGAAATAGAGESSRSANQILADVQRDIGAVKSYHFEGRSTDADGVTRIHGDVTASGSLRLSLTLGQATSQIIVLPAQRVYVKGNAAYWRGAGAGVAVAGQIADRWVRLPADQTAGVTAQAVELTPKRLARCVDVGVGTVVKRGVRTYHGRKVVVLEDRGDKPGTAPGEAWVAQNGRALVLRETQTGPRRAGPVDGTCVSKDDTTKVSDLRLSHFDKVGRITAPADVVAIPGSGQGGPKI